MNEPKRTCIIHYEDQSSYSPTVKKLSAINIARISEAKEKRIKLGGANEHKEQIIQIPDEINPELHGIHLEPCYKRYEYN